MLMDIAHIYTVHLYVLNIYILTTSYYNDLKSRFRISKDYEQLFQKKKQEKKLVQHIANGINGETLFRYYQYLNTFFTTKLLLKFHYFAFDCIMAHHNTDYDYINSKLFIKPTHILTLIFHFSFYSTPKGHTVHVSRFAAYNSISCSD